MTKKEVKYAQCNKCGARMLWFKTKNGKNVPVNPTPKIIEDHAAKVVFDPREHTAHWQTCINAAPHHKENRGRR